MRLPSFLRNESGNFAVTFAICALPVLLSAGIAMDYTQAYRFRGRLQNAVDAATLAVGRDLAKLNDAEVKQQVMDYVGSNLEAGDRALVGAYKIDIDRKKLALKVTADARMPANFAPLVGIKTMDYRVVASIRSATGGIEAVLVLDNTGSMARGGRMVSLKKAAKAFVEDMMARNDGQELARIGIVPFADYVNVGVDKRKASWIDVPDGARWNGCVGSRDYPLNLRDGNFSIRVPAAVEQRCPSEITPLTDDAKLLRRQINTMRTQGYTYVPTGLAWGLRALSAEAPFSEGLTKAKAEEKRIKKALILMTDGENTVSVRRGSHLHDGRDIKQANAWTLDACGEIKKAGILVYTMTFGTEVPQTTKDIIRACATGPEYYFDADNGDRLTAAFADIAASLNKLYLTQ